MTETVSLRRPTAQSGPHLGVVAGVSAGLLIAALASSAALGGVFPSPFSDPTTITTYVARERNALRISSVLLFGSSVPFVVYSATAAARLRQLGVTAPGATIALAGGTVAGAALALSGLLQWVLSRPAVGGSEALVRALHDLTFLSGGPAHVVFFGLLLAGIAVPGLMLGLLPRATAWAGLGLAGLAELSFLTLVWPQLGFLLPLARFPGLVWLVVAGVQLPRQRPRRPSSPTT
jgi:hypothetical protein